jgi:hypothetical protein
MLLPVIIVFVAPNSSSDLQLAKTAMSPAEHSRKHRQRTNPRKNGAGMLLPVQLVSRRLIKVTADVFSNTLMSPAEHSRKHRQRTATTGPKAGCGNVLTADFCPLCAKLLKRLAIGQDSYVTCRTIKEAS